MVLRLGNLQNHGFMERHNNASWFKPCTVWLITAVNDVDKRKNDVDSVKNDRF